MFFRKKQKIEEVKEENHADTACTKIEALLKQCKIDAVIIAEDKQDADLLTRALRKRNLKCIGEADPDEVDRVIRACNPKVIVLDFVGNEKIAERIMVQYPERAVICSGFIEVAMDELAAKVKGVFSKNNVNELAEYIKGCK